MNRKNNLESSQLSNSSIFFTNASHPRVNKEKVLLKPIDLTNKIKNMMDNLERMSVPVVGDFYIKRKKKKVSKITHSSELNKKIHKKRESILNGTQALDKEKQNILENLTRAKLESNKSKQHENKNISTFKSENSTEDTGSIQKNYTMNTKSVFKNSFFLSPFNSNFKYSTHYTSKSPSKMKTGINFSKTPFKLRKSYPINNIETEIIKSSLTNSNLTPKYLLDSKRDNSNRRSFSKINFKLPSFTPHPVTNFTSRNSQSIYHKKFNSITSQPNASMQFSDFFKLTNVISDKSTSASKLIDMNLSSVKLGITSKEINSSSLKLDITSKKFMSNLSKNKTANSTLQKLSSFQLNSRSAYEDPNFRLNNKDKFIEFVKTCDEEKEISQYAYDVMGKFFKTSYPDRPIRKKISAEQIEKDDMFRMQNAAKKYFIFSEEKGIFISEDFGINEVLNFTRRINGIHPIGSYKFRKIIGDRIGLNVLEEGNQLRLVTLQQPSDMKNLKRNQKFSKQHEDIVNHLDSINSKKKSLKKREKNYSWQQNNVNIISN